MPFGDGTGPLGQGPMTGRGAGYCAGFGMPGFMNPYPGRGYFCWGWFGRGRGWRNWYRATGLPGWFRAGIGLPAWGGWRYYSPVYPPAGSYQPTKDQEEEMLTQELEALKQEMEDIQARLKELKGSKKIKVEKE